MAFLRQDSKNNHVKKSTYASKCITRKDISAQKILRTYRVFQNVYLQDNVRTILKMGKWYLWIETIAITEERRLMLIMVLDGTFYKTVGYLVPLSQRLLQTQNIQL